MTHLLTQWRAYRTQVIRDRRDDTQHYLDKWGWARSPSELRKLRAKIEKLDVRLEARRG